MRDFRPSKFRPSKHAIDRYRERFGVSTDRGAENALLKIARRIERKMELPKAARDYAYQRAYQVGNVVLLVNIKDKTIITCYPGKK